MFGCSIKGVKALTVLSVRIGAPIEQVISEVRVPVLRREMQSGHCPGRCRARVVDVDAIAYMNLDRFGTSQKSGAAKRFGGPLVAQTARRRSRRAGDRRGQKKHVAVTVLSHTQMSIASHGRRHAARGSHSPSAAAQAHRSQRCEYIKTTSAAQRSDRQDRQDGPTGR